RPSFYYSYADLRVLHSAYFWPLQLCIRVNGSATVAYPQRWRVSGAAAGADPLTLTQLRARERQPPLECGHLVENNTGGR
ncbi:hypothetical protein ELP13_29655, partial [Klebsiella pneumoniae]|nr:hypothetical protein [Klebsiella pneumoniae]